MPVLTVLMEKRITKLHIRYVRYLTIFCVCTLGFSAVNFADAAEGLSFPALTPFRGQGMDRDIFSTEYFMDCFSYRYSYEQEALWLSKTMGYRGTAGSVASDEFFIDHRFVVGYDLTDELRFHARAVEMADLDGRYRRFTLGLKQDLTQRLTLGVYGEVIPEKGGNDVGFTLASRHLPGHVVTLGFELPDVLMNQKGGDTLHQGYSRQPRALYLAVRGRLGPRVRWDWVVRENFPLTLAHDDKLLSFRYAQLSTYGRVQVLATSRTRLLFYAGGEGADLGFRPYHAGSAYERKDVLRRSYQGRVEVRHTINPMITPYAGGRVFRLAEQMKFREPSSWPRGRYVHREYFFYGGASLRLSRRVIFRPEVIAGHVDRVVRNHEHLGTADTDHRFMGKLSTPFEFVFNESARITASVSFDLDEMKFGGGMVSLQMSL